MQADIKQ